MQHDEVVWQIINQGFCSFKTKIARERTFCQNPYNVTGLCLRSACPLANSSYATIREEEGTCYLFVKTVERAHSPKNLWEKIKLPVNYEKALEIVSTHLEEFPKYLVHRNKQRLTKIHQMLIRMRRLQLKAGPKIETLNTKVEQREKGRERKALQAAQLDKAIEKELLERLKQVTSEKVIYNYPEKQYNKMVSQYQEEEGEEEEEEEDPDVLEEDEEAEEENEEELEEEEQAEQEEGNYDIEYIEDFEESEGDEDDEEEEEEAVEDLGSALLGSGRFSLPSTSYYSKSSNNNNSNNNNANMATTRSSRSNSVGSSGSQVAGNKRSAAATGAGAASTSTKRTKKADNDYSNKRNKKEKGKGKGARVEIEYEMEEESVAHSKVKEDGNMEFNF